MAKSVFTADYEAFLELLKERRNRAKITQVGLAEALVTTQSSVSKVERGERRLDVVELKHWCDALGISFVGFTRELERRMVN